MVQEPRDQFTFPKSPSGLRLMFPMIVFVVSAGVTVGFSAIALVEGTGILFTNKMPPQKTAAVLPTVNHSFPDVAIQAQAAYVYDVNTRKGLYGKNAEVQLPLASLTKLMTTMVATEAFLKNAPIVIGNNDLRKEGESGLRAEEIFALKDLTDFVLLASSNDGASALASAVEALATKRDRATQEQRSTFIELLNQKAVALNLTQTYFTNETGLDNQTLSAANFGSAHDMALLMAYIVRKHPDLIDATRYTEKTIMSQTAAHRAINTNAGVEHIPGILGSKTGFTDAAGGNLVIAFDAGFSKPIIISVLGSTIVKRFSDVETLAAAALEYFYTKQ